MFLVKRPVDTKDLYGFLVVNKSPIICLVRFSQTVARPGVFTVAHKDLPVLNSSVTKRCGKPTVRMENGNLISQESFLRTVISFQGIGEDFPFPFIL